MAGRALEDAKLAGEGSPVKGEDFHEMMRFDPS